MKRIGFGVLFTAAFAALVFSMTVEPATQVAFAQRNSRVASKDRGSSPFTFGTIERVDKLRKEYTQLVTVKAQLMGLDELQKEIEATTREIRELEAKQELESALQTLNELIEGFPETEAAGKAKELLGNSDPDRDTQRNEDDTNE